MHRSSGKSSRLFDWLIICSASVWGQANFTRANRNRSYRRKSGSLEDRGADVSHHLGNICLANQAVILQQMARRSSSTGDE